MSTTAQSTAPTGRRGRTLGPVLLDVRGLSVDYLTTHGPVRACADVSLTLRRGEILGVAGESGSGKSTLVTALTRLQRPPAVTAAGSVEYRPVEGEPVDLVTLSERRLRRLRWRDLAIVMQSAMDCLNPVMRLGAQFVDVIREHDRSMSTRAAKARTAELLRMVGIPAERAASYPHELSGGMRQRSLIALALACDPALVVMDEPTTAVDVVMQRQILAQLVALQQTLHFAIVFVTHDLSLLLELADRIAVMYAGRIVEIGSAYDIYRSPRHPYTEGLRTAFPPLRAPVRRMTGIPGAPPDLADLPPGCAFAPRCRYATDDCTTAVPALRPVGAQHVACVRTEEADDAR
ncbi:ABC transporter ATP-binding protein [Actinocatenispora rupis]|uniref:Dipeptide/oligopeptide/nickel ABC transporter ATP-binding protein n=1 Tax=Actinocatenispora rupis TaxID=519421 RepID=A0A8J3J6N9_9ACTN|nr:ABC transporter ATP-binding protein [Actinocatenispora rupis]GID10393.1 dipeptide/oligopeptide/nickel ABC transporter ATP-binding protein [Actinocatenispora rupis]